MSAAVDLFPEFSGDPEMDARIGSTLRGLLVANAAYGLCGEFTFPLWDQEVIITLEQHNRHPIPWHCTEKRDRKWRVEIGRFADGCPAARWWDGVSSPVTT